MKGKITFFVKGTRAAVGTEVSGRWGWAGRSGQRVGGLVVRDYEAYSEARYESILSDEQKRTVQLVQEIAAQHSYELEVIDVASESVLDRFIEKEIRKVKIFPTLL